MPADVRQFVQQKRLHLPGRQTGQSANRNQRHGTKPAHDRGCLHDRRYEQANRTRDANAIPQSVECLLPLAGCGADRAGAKALGEHPPASQPEPESHRTRQPHCYYPREKRRRQCAEHIDVESGRYISDSRGLRGRNRRREGSPRRGRRGRMQQAPRQHRRGGHNGQGRAGQPCSESSGWRSALSLSRAARINRCNRHALPEKVKQRPAETFHPRLSGQNLECVHFAPPFFLSSASIICRISASSSLEAG